MQMTFLARHDLAEAFKVSKKVFGELGQENGYQMGAKFAS
jgi:hypothetical protein